MIYPLLSTSCREHLQTVFDLYGDEIAKEILTADRLVEWIRYYATNTDDIITTVVSEKIDSMITNVARAITIKPTFEATYTPEGKELIYTSDYNWSTKNRQSGKPTKLFKKLLKKEFKEQPYENFNNRLRSVVENFGVFKVVSGSDITYYYNENTYYEYEGTLGNSCMRYPECNTYFKVYEDHAKMLVLLKNDKVCGRAILWEWDGKTFMDRVYVCKDYLVDTFINYAKDQKWHIRQHQRLMEDDEILWYSPEDNYECCDFFDIKIDLGGKTYNKMPYIDSICYYDGNYLYARYNDDFDKLNNTDGTYSDSYDITYCSTCGCSSEDHVIHWCCDIEDYRCDEHSIHIDGENVYISDNSTWLYSKVKTLHGDWLFTDNFIKYGLVSPNKQIITYNRYRYYFMMIDDVIYSYHPDFLEWNSESNSYEPKKD